MKKLLSIIASIFAFTATALTETEQSLLDAAKIGNLPEIEQLLKQNPDLDINVKGKYGITTLMYASYIADEEHMEIVPYLINAGADVNAKDDYGFTALMILSSRGYPKLAQLLLDAGADVHAENDAGLTALIYAAVDSKDLKIVQSLLDAGADVNAKNKNGKTALSLALEYGFTEIAEYLAPTDVEQSFLMAAEQGDLKKIKQLLKQNPDLDVNVKAKYGLTALMYASHIADEEHMEIVPYLINAGADVNAKDDYGFTALMILSSRGYPELVQLLIDAGADVHAENDAGFTALIYAAVDSKNLEIVQSLLDAGADVNAENKNGKTALILALEHGFIEIVEYLAPEAIQE